MTVVEYNALREINPELNLPEVSTLTPEAFLQLKDLKAEELISKRVEFVLLHGALPGEPKEVATYGWIMPKDGGEPQPIQRAMMGAKLL